MKQLGEHVAVEYAGWYYSNLILAPGHPDPVEATAAALPPMPDEFEELLDYIARNASRFADQPGGIDLDRDVWVFDSVGPARFWLRQTIMDTSPVALVRSYLRPCPDSAKNTAGSTARHAAR